MYDGRKHACLEDSHIVNIFSFSKAYGMMGWRVGYVSVLYTDFCVLVGWGLLEAFGIIFLLDLFVT